MKPSEHLIKLAMEKSKTNKKGEIHLGRMFDVVLEYIDEQNEKQEKINKLMLEIFTQSVLVHPESWIKLRELQSIILEVKNDTRTN